MKGSLEDKSFAQVYYEILTQSHSGVLLLSVEKAKKEIHFLKGAPVFAKSNIVSEAFGQFLISKKVIDKATLERLLAEKDPKTQIGKLLLSKNLVSPAQFAELLQEHLLLKLEQAFLWTKGEFEFFENAPISDDHMTLDLSKDKFFWQCFKRAASPNLRQIKLKPFRDKKISLSPHEIDVGLSGTELKALRELRQEVAAAPGLEAALAAMTSQRELKEQLLCLFVELKWAVHELTDDEKLITQMKEKIKGFKSMDHFQILGLPFDADVSTVKKTYFELAKKFHPDKVSSTASPDYKKALEEYFSHITIAHKVLTDIKERQEYVTALTMTRDGTLDRMQKALGSEEHFERAKIAMKRRNFEAAKIELEQALQLNPDDAEYWADLGWCQFNIVQKTKADPDGREIKQVEETLQKAHAMNKTLGNTFFYLGHLWLYRQNEEKAEGCFAKCVEMMPHNQEAQSQLRILQMRMEKKKDKGFFKRMFHK